MNILKLPLPNAELVPVRIRLHNGQDAASATKLIADLARRLNGQLAVVLHGSPVTINVPREAKLYAMAALNSLGVGRVEDMPDTLHGWLQQALETLADQPADRLAVVFTSGPQLHFSVLSTFADREGPLEMAALFGQASVAGMSLERQRRAGG